ncbi:MAG: hypothetical protein ACRD5K_12280 [Candidatus Acidiferrales bacterium]
MRVAGKAKLRSSVCLFALAGALWVAGCGKGGSGSTNVRSVAITPTSVSSLPLNQQTEFTATITLSNSTVSTTTNITWEVNGQAGGGTVGGENVGSIVPSSVDQNVGVYTAPGAVPNPATVNITAVVQQTNTTSSTSSTIPTVTSNTATVTIGIGLGLSMTPAAATVPAGGRQQFTALLNSVQDPAATWSISSASGITDASVIGSIGLTGLYTAPASPPPGGTITVTATDGVNTATATVSVVYSDLSLNGPYAFSYTGNDESGYLAAAGSFLADGQGHITSGVEDVDSFLNGLAVAAPISGIYSVGNDGRGTATITRGQITERWRFALTTGLHAAMTLSEPNATGGGTIDQQSVGALSNSPAVITGPYVFKLLGADASANRSPLGMAGEFSANGGGDVLAADGTLIDVNDNGTIPSTDTSLNGTYAFDPNNPDSGRGTITLSSTPTGPREYAFYAVSTAIDPSTNASYVTQMHLIEIDNAGYVDGDMFSAPSASALGSGDLSAANYAFTYGGSSSSGAYAAGGVFTSDGSGSVTGGVLDTNNAGTTALNTTISGCTSSLDGTKRRIELTCTAGSTSPKFAMYQTSVGSAVMLEIDPTAVATGTAYAQCGPSSAGCAAAAPAISADSVALSLIGQGIFHNSPSLYQQDIDGQISVGSGVTPGSIDINNFTATFVGDPISTVALGSASSLGRGTTVMTASTPAATYNLIYYLIDDKTALDFDQDSTYVMRGAFAQQY